jgi:excisionase family DNA binding protein
VPTITERTRRRRAPRRPDAPPPRRLAGFDIAADWLDCDERTIRRMAHRGQLSGFRVGRHLKVDLNEVEALMVPVPPESVSA